MTVSGIAPPNGAELELLALIRQLAEARDHLRCAHEAAKSAEETARFLGGRVNELNAFIAERLKELSAPESE